MFENSSLFKVSADGQKPLPRSGRALRVVGWSDLTARINAARDLRELLRDDLVMDAASFTDAAAGYFGRPAIAPGARSGDEKEQGQQPVNQNVLEGSKRSGGTEVEHDNQTGPTRGEGPEPKAAENNK